MCRDRSCLAGVRHRQLLHAVHVRVEELHGWDQLCPKAGAHRDLCVSGDLTFHNFISVLDLHDRRPTGDPVGDHDRVVRVRHPNTQNGHQDGHRRHRR